MQTIRKILRAVSEIFKDGRTNKPQTDMGDYIGPPWVNRGPKSEYMQKTEKTNGQSLEIFKDGPRTDQKTDQGTY